MSRWGSTLLRVSAEDVIHNFVLVGAVVSRNVHILPENWINISAEWVRIVMESDSLSVAQKCCKSNYFHIHIFIYFYNYIMGYFKTIIILLKLTNEINCFHM